jgi:transcription elongation factor GreA
MPDDRIPMSREGFDKKKAELDHLQNVEMIAVTKRVAAARDMGDLSENAEYHAAREDQGILQARINEMKSQLARAMIVEKNNGPTDSVIFGCRVRIRDLDFEEEEEFVLVGPGEEDHDNNKILMTSPIGQGLVGKKVGEIASIPVPKGTLRFEILEIEVA